MISRERFEGLMNGKPGPVVNEDFSKERGWFLYYAFYDDNGQLAGYVEFSRDTSPKKISDILKESADELLQCYPEDWTWEEAVTEADRLRKMAESVPGLKVE